MDFKAPKAQEIVHRLRAETKLNLTLADNINQERPALGSLSCRNAPAWWIMNALADSKIIKGKWEPRGDGYCLTSPLPPPAVTQTSPSETPSPPGPSKPGPANLLLRYLLSTIPLLALVGIIILIRRRRNTQQAVVVSEHPDVPKTPTSS